MPAKVAPPAGAWIETSVPVSSLTKCEVSRPLRARGLKHELVHLIHGTMGKSRPLRARGLKQ